jgi:hypothetical protein
MTPPWAVAQPTHLCQQRGGSIVIRGVRAGGKDEVRTFGAWWGLELFSVLTQFAIQYFGTKAQNLEDLVGAGAVQRVDTDCYSVLWDQSPELRRPGGGWSCSAC